MFQVEKWLKWFIASMKKAFIRTVGFNKKKANQKRKIFCSLKKLL